MHRYCLNKRRSFIISETVLMLNRRVVKIKGKYFRLREILKIVFCFDKYFLNKSLELLNHCLKSHHS